MKVQFILFLLIVSFLISCDRTLKLSEEDFKWIPYKGNETLVFKSNSGESDTIFILKKDTIFDYPEAQAINGVKCEQVGVFSNTSSGNDQRTDRSFYLFKVQKAKDGHTDLAFDLSLQGSLFYRIRPVKADSLIKVDPTSIQTTTQQFDDVYLIYPDGYGKDFSDRSNFVTKLYWSKSQGLIRFDKNDSIYWELKNKY